MWVRFETNRNDWTEDWTHQAVVLNPDDKPVKAVRDTRTGIQIEPKKIVYRQPDDEGIPLVVLFFNQSVRGEVAL